MALLTEDLEIVPSDTWTEITCGTSMVAIVDIVGNYPIRYRFGATSTSVGALYRANSQAIIADESIYVKVLGNEKVTLIINKD